MKPVSRWWWLVLAGLWMGGIGWIGSVPQATASAFPERAYQVYLPMAVNGAPAAAPATCPRLPSQASADDAFEAQTLELINQERAKVGAPPLQPSASLQQIARFHSNDMAVSGVFSHDGSQGEPFGERMSWGCERFSYAGEIIAYNYTDPAAAVQGWMNSPAHHDILLDPVYTHAGAGYASSAAGPNYWTVDFISVRP